LAVPQPIPEFISDQVSEARYFFLENASTTRTRAPLSVVCGGYEACAADYQIQRDTFKYHSIEHVIRGHGRLTLGGRSYDLKPGSTYSYGPGRPHEIYADPRDPPSKYFVDFIGRGATALLNSAALPSGTVRRLVPGGDVVQLLELLIRNGTRPNPHTPRVCQALLETIAAKIAEPSHVGEDAEKGDRSRLTYLHCREILDRHFLGLHSLQELAERCGLDQAYLCRLFRRFDTDSPYRALIRNKMNYAAIALVRSDRLVKQIASELGYRDPYQFSRAFTRIHGASPTVFKTRAKLPRLTH